MLLLLNEVFNWLLHLLPNIPSQKHFSFLFLLTTSTWYILQWEVMILLILLLRHIDKLRWLDAFNWTSVNSIYSLWYKNSLVIRWRRILLIRLRQLLKASLLQWKVNMWHWWILIVSKREMLRCSLYLILILIWYLTRSVWIFINDIWAFWSLLLAL